MLCLWNKRLIIDNFVSKIRFWKKNIYFRKKFLNKIFEIFEIWLKFLFINLRWIFSWFKLSIWRLLMKFEIFFSKIVLFICKFLIFSTNSSF